VLLSLSTWPEVEAYLRNCDAIVVPIGSTEQHGPNGLIGTDAICAEHVACGVGGRTGVLVAPTISVGMAAHHMAFPGSMSHTPTVLISIVREQVMALAAHGFRNFFFVNGHGGNIATINSAFAEIHALRWQAGLPAIRCQLANWWDPAGVAELSQEYYGDVEGSHATASEIAITRHLFPDHAKNVVLDPAVAPTGEFHDAADFRQRFPDGRIGSNPGLSEAKHGERILQSAIAGLVEMLRVFIAMKGA